ncbi:ABC transporter ATP-binding protein [Vallitalea pronyensis]|uniref:ABC transporter ATP-binding protein n=2 Tax=Vallitalea pronyensis TaxID=1348613 RepID=A0A8J8MQQ6_9FIRM|nr:ABC transporter ATP-binding protein [Vallitalea pronyensis]QUI25821.1 ABC transporter ATP-binding protein [Vallitalea pronyensis]
MVCALLIAVIGLSIPMVSKHALDLIAEKDFNTFFLIILGILVAHIIRAALQYIVDYWGHILGVRMEYDMRKDLFRHLQSLSFRYYDKTRTGHIMSRMVNDLNEMTELAHHGPEDLFLSFMMLIGAFFAMVFMEWRLALAVYLFIPFLIWFAVKQRVKMSEGFRNVKKKIANVNAQLESSISGIRVSKSFANEEHEMDKFTEGNKAFRVSKNTAFKNMSIFMLGMGFTTNILNLVVIGFGGYLIYGGYMDLNTLLAFILYVNAFSQPIRKLTNFVQQFESGMAGFDRFMEIMEIKPLINDLPHATQLKDVKGHIRFNNVTFSYNDHEKVLNNIKLDIDAGKTLALVGPSGGGKTTLCHLIPRFYEVDEGEITIDDKDIKHVKIKSLRENIGLVSQDVFLFAGTIKDNIMYGNVNANEEELILAAKNAEIHDFIKDLPDGYDTNVGERGIRLSGGQKQRISIARVFLKNPPILILDEATSALDNETEIKIQRALEKLSKGRTTLVIAHRLSTIKNADEIVVITEDGIKEKGSHHDLLQIEGTYAKLYKAQFKGYIPDEID